MQRERERTSLSEISTTTLQGGLLLPYCKWKWSEDAALTSGFCRKNGRIVQKLSQDVRKLLEGEGMWLRSARTCKVKGVAVFSWHRDGIWARDEIAVMYTTQGDCRGNYAGQPENQAITVFSMPGC